MPTAENRIPSRVRHVHLIAACGTGMGALAAMLQDAGLTVTGSDHKVYPPMSDFLARRGIAVAEGFDARNLAPRPDLVVVGNAVSRDNAEVVALQRMGLAYCSMPQAVNHFAAAGKKVLLVAGTHGKTTTSALLAWTLHAAGCDPSFMIGGLLKNFDGNYRLGRGAHFVVEGDEYDTAYFDKGPKFLHYTPEVAVLTSVEFDHADIFTDLEHVRATFAAFIARLPAGSLLVAYDGDPNVSLLAAACPREVQLYGTAASSAWRLGRVALTPPWTHFEVLHGDRSYGRFRSPLMGRHNLLNTLAVVAVAARLGLSAGRVAQAVETFAGVRRRQEIRGCKRGVTVIDDFAHHPTAVRETLQAVRPFFPNGRLVAVFEPRTNSSMRRVFQSVYPLVFDAADLICIRKPPLLKKIPPGQRFSSARLVRALQARGKSARYFEDTEAILDYLSAVARPGDAVLIMSNGGFDNIHDRLLERL